MCARARARARTRVCIVMCYGMFAHVFQGSLAEHALHIMAIYMRWRPTLVYMGCL